MEFINDEKECLVLALNEYAHLKNQIAISTEAIEVTNYKFNSLNNERIILRNVLKTFYLNLKKIPNIKINSDIDTSYQLATNFKPIKSHERFLLGRMKYDLNDYDGYHFSNEKEFLSMKSKTHLRPSVDLFVNIILNLDTLNTEFYLKIVQKDQKALLNWFINQLSEIFILKNSPKSKKNNSPRANWNKIAILLFKYTRWDEEFGNLGQITRKELLESFGNLPQELDKTINQRLESRNREWVKYYKSQSIK